MAKCDKNLQSQVEIASFILIRIQSRLRESTKDRVAKIDVLYAPLFFGIPRYDFVGFVISLTYSWTFLINIIGLGSE